MKANKYSQHKIVYFPKKVDSFRDGTITAPIYVRIKPINRCNHDCFFCVYSAGFRNSEGDGHVESGMHEDMREEDVLPTAKAYEILDDFKEIGVRAVTYSGGGEPLLHKDIADIMQRTLDNQIDLSIITNGQLLAKRRAEILAHAKWVRVSMDYTDAEQMASTRRVPVGSFASILKNIENFAKIKNSDCDLSVNYIIYKHNYENLYEFIRNLKERGVENVRLSPMWTQDFAEYHAPIADAVNAELEKARGLIDDNFSLDTTYNIDAGVHTSERSYTKCYVMQTVPVVGADQMVYACHNKAYDNTGVIGSIKDQSFRDLWFSEEAAKVFNTLNPKVSCQHQCANDMKNIFLHDLIDGKPDNFV